MPIRVDGELFRNAQASAELHSRSAAQQLAHWARLGRAFESLPTTTLNAAERALRNDSSKVSSYAEQLRDRIAAHRSEIAEILERYGATSPRLFGSVARGDAGPHSDIDLLVDLTLAGGNPVLRLSGLAEELSGLLEVKVEVVTEALLREPVAASALGEMVPL